MKHTENTLKQQLEEAFQPDLLTLRDDTHKHITHAQNTGDHFHVVMVSSAFEGQSRLQRHRRVYKLLEKSFTPMGIHALALRLFTPKEWQSQKN